MATTRKSGGARSASRSAPQKKSGGKRMASSSSRSRSGGSGGRKKQSAPARRPLRREIGGVVCLLLAVFSALGYFHKDAIFINFFSGLLKGLFGYGFWLAAPALLMSAYILLFHRGRPVALRLTCTLLLPMMVSALLHGLLADPLEWNGSIVKTLWESGKALHSGGVLSGLMAQGCVSLFTAIGSTVLFGVAAVLMGFGACNRTPLDLIHWAMERPDYEEYEYEEPAPRRGKREAAPAPAAPVSRGRREIDFPVDDGPLVAQEDQPQPQPEPKKRGFFDRKPRVPSPDQLLTGRREEPAAAQEGAEDRSPEEWSQETVPPLHAPVPSFLPRRKPAPEPIPEPEPQPEPVERSFPEPDDEPESAPAAATQMSEPVVTAPPVRPAAPAPIPVTPAAPAAPVQPDPETAAAAEIAQAADQVAQDIQAGQGGSSRPYQYPPLSLLQEGSGEIGGEALAELNTNRQRLNDTIHSFGIDANIVNVTRGPSVTRYELELDQGVRLNKLTNLADDIALSLGAAGVRIAPIPDQIAMVGIEVPNKAVSPVNIHSVIGSKAFTDSASKVSFALGKDISGNPIVGNIAKLPHLLIAGTTGSGKSVCTNSIITSLLYKATPEEVRLIMVDPKMVELGIYNGIPHLLIPVVTDPKKAAGALQWAVTEMMKRYRTFSEVGVRKLEEYNALAARTEGMEKMPYIVVLIDELADLMLVAAKEVEESICRVAQMGRAAGMHMIVATQRPSADVITGLMKANIPSRIAFAVASSMESRIILDLTGAEKLVGRGDMLYAPLGVGKPTRVQGCFISDQEVAAVVDFVKKSGTAQYDDAVMQEIEQHAAEKEKGTKGVGGSAPDDVGSDYDELIDAAAEVVVETGQASVSMLQRRLKLGYARAARLVDQLEEKGIVGPFEGSKPRQLLITKEQWQELKYRQGTVTAAPAPEEAPPPPPPVMAEPEPVFPPPAETDAPPFDLDDELDQAGEDRL